MYNTGRRRSRFNDDRLFSIPISSLSEDECLSVAAYLFELSKNVPNEIIFDEERFFTLLSQLATNLGVYTRLQDVLDCHIQELLRMDRLHYMDDEENDDEIDTDSTSGRTVVANRRRARRRYCVYEEDDELFHRCDFNGESEVLKNYCRVIYIEARNTYPQLIYQTLFTKAKINIAKAHNDLPVRILAKARDVSKVNFIKKEVGLTDQETGYLLLRYRKATVENLGDAFNALSRNSVELYTKLLNISKSDFSKIVRPDQKLRQFGFINEARELNPALIECIENQDFSLYFADCIKPVDLKSSYDINSFCVPEMNTCIYKNMLTSSDAVSILLYGNPGSGKTEYAKALINSTGKNALIFKNESEVIDKNETLERLNCLLSLNRKDTVLIIDEADTLLETAKFSFFGMVMSSDSKGLVNKMLESSQNKVIFIVNHKNQMDESTLRRFTVSYKFEAMSPAMLESIADKKLKDVNLSADAKKDILKMLSRYKVTGASVDNMVKAINSMREKDETKLLKNIEVVLNDNSLLLHGKAAMRENVNPAYDISVLNTSISAEKVMKMLKNAKNYADKNPGAGAIRMLFYGLSGTGKTEFARYISQALGKKILLKRASDIFGKYVGETEENIAKAFSEAARNDQILLFDEADSFFSDRKNATRNFERTQVNEFLTQLEEFPGIVICTTNLRNIMDAAMLRRFHITVDFKALTEDGIETLLSKYFSDYEFDHKLVRRLADWNSVTPGDFSRLSSTIRFMDPEEITAEYIVDELSNIQREKQEDGSLGTGKKIGFCA